MNNDIPIIGGPTVEQLREELEKAAAANMQLAQAMDHNAVVAQKHMAEGKLLRAKLRDIRVYADELVDNPMTRGIGHDLLAIIDRKED